MNSVEARSCGTAGSRWLGEVPSHWHITRLKNAADYWVSNVDKVPAEGEVPVRLCNYTDVYYNEHLHPNLSLMQTTATAAEIRRFHLQVGDVVITKDSEEWSDIAVPALVTGTAPDLVCGYHLAIVRPRPSRLYGPFLQRVFQAAGVNTQLQVSANGITRYSLPKSAIGEALIPMPPMDEQHAIAHFLDHETAKVDDLVDCKGTLLRQLEDREQSLIASAVCRGLNGSARTRATGIPWVGDVPEHWELLHLRRVVKKFVDYRGRTPEKVLEGIPLVTAVNIKNGRIDLGLGQEFMPEADYDEWMIRGLPERGDLLVTTEAPLGEVAQIEDTRVALAQRIILLKVKKEKISNEYLKYFFRSAAGQGELLTRASGSTALGIKASRFKGIAVVVPPLSEQCAIVAYLDHETSRLSQLKTAVEASLPKLAKYRSSLISAAVTGQIDVRTYRPQEVAALCQ